MRTIKSVAAMQRLALEWKHSGIQIGFVPTMGYLHAGHISLVTEARKRVGPKSKVVLSIYVNPTQFGPKEDFSKYPRDLKRDTQLCRAGGVDVIFAPADTDMYPRPEGYEYSTYVYEETLAKQMEGASRPTHFRGVTTIVAKLFNIVLPDVSIFGAKDWQQATIIQRMVRDLNFPLKVIVAPTHRETDGLAMSSRNKYLSTEERAQATILWHTIQTAKAEVKAAKAPLNATRLKEKLTKLIATQPAARLDYIEFFAPNALTASPQVTKGTHMALAVFFGKTRLIDNARL
ncbi:MAG TPA: pantoate--beta-alanine ligase [Verrucomicrobiae bacterium]